MHSFVSNYTNYLVLSCAMHACIIHALPIIDLFDTCQQYHLDVHKSIHLYSHIFFAVLLAASSPSDCTGSVLWARRPMVENVTPVSGSFSTELNCVCAVCGTKPALCFDGLIYLAHTCSSTATQLARTTASTQWVDNQRRALPVHAHAGTCCTTHALAFTSSASASFTLPAAAPT